MALSLAQAAKRALYDGLTTALPDVKVTVGQAIDKVEESVIVGPQDRPLTFDQEWHSFGAGSTRSEELAVPVTVEVFRGGQDEFTAEDRAWEIAEEIAAWLATRPLEGDGIFEAHPDRGEQVTENYADGRLARVSLVVACTGRVHGI